MLSKTGLISTLWVFAAMPVVAAGQPRLHASVPPASFLNYHVSTVHELSQEVTLDPAVRARLANHFHISEAQITQYVRQNLVLTHLKWSGYYRVACVGRNGQEFWITSHLPKGTPIFASRATGHPILKLGLRQSDGLFSSACHSDNGKHHSCRPAAVCLAVAPNGSQFYRHAGLADGGHRAC